MFKDNTCSRTDVSSLLFS